MTAVSQIPVPTIVHPITSAVSGALTIPELKINQVFS